MTNITQFCKDTLQELSQLRNVNKEDVFLHCVNERLDKSFKMYEKELDTGLQYLKRRNELNVIRKLNKLK